MQHLLIAGLVVAALAGGCSRRGEIVQEAKARDTALVRFVNADPDDRLLDLWFGDTRRFSSVEYKRVTAYAEVPAERKSFQLRQPGQLTNLASNSDGLDNGRRYTIVAYKKKDGAYALTVVADDLSAGATGKAKVRMLNAAPLAGELDLVHKKKNANQIFDGVDFNTATKFKEVDPGEGTLLIRREDRNKTVVRPDVTVEADKAYTIIVTGDRALDTIRIEDRLAG